MNSECTVGAFIAWIVMHTDYVSHVALVYEDLSFVLSTSLVYMTQKGKSYSDRSRCVHRQNVLRSTVCSQLATFCGESNVTLCSIIFRFLAIMCEERNACDGSGASAGCFLLSLQCSPRPKCVLNTNWADS